MSKQAVAVLPTIGRLQCSLNAAINAGIKSSRCTRSDDLYGDYDYASLVSVYSRATGVVQLELIFNKQRFLSNQLPLMCLLGWHLLAYRLGVESTFLQTPL